MMMMMTTMMVMMGDHFAFLHTAQHQIDRSFSLNKKINKNSTKKHLSSLVSSHLISSLPYLLILVVRDVIFLEDEAVQLPVVLEEGALSLVELPLLRLRQRLVKSLPTVPPLSSSLLPCLGYYLGQRKWKGRGERKGWDGMRQEIGCEKDRGREVGDTGADKGRFAVAFTRRGCAGKRRSRHHGGGGVCMQFGHAATGVLRLDPLDFLVTEKKKKKREREREKEKLANGLICKVKLSSFLIKLTN